MLEINVKTYRQYEPVGFQAIKDIDLRNKYQLYIDEDSGSKIGFDKELLVTDKKIVCSLGGRVEQVFNFENKRETVKKAIWTRFPDYQNRDHLRTDDGFVDALCVVIETSIHVFYSDGQQFIIPLPERLHDIWPKQPSGIYVSFDNPDGVLDEKYQDFDDYASIQVETHSRRSNFGYILEPIGFIKPIFLEQEKPTKGKSASNTPNYKSIVRVVNVNQADCFVYCIDSTSKLRLYYLKDEEGSSSITSQPFIFGSVE